MFVRSRHRLFCALIVLAIGGTASAAEVEGLYTAAVPVAGKDDGARRAALGRALLAVLIKVSGERSPATRPALAPTLARPGKLIQQYQYETATGEGGPATAGKPPLAAPAGRLTLSARFDRAAVNMLLREAGLPVWGRVRPSVLAWLALEGPNGRELIGAGDEGGFFAVLSATAGQRGLPVVAPLLDLDDRRVLRVTDVWGGFNETILRASRRYGGGAVVTGRVFRVLPTLWEGRWTLLDGGTVDSWTVRADVAEAVVEEGMNGAADRLARRYARVENSSLADGLSISITGVDSLQSYARVVAYLDSLDLVTRVQVTRVAPGRVAFDVGARGGLPALKQIIALGRTLVDAGATDGSRFRLLP